MDTREFHPSTRGASTEFSVFPMTYCQPVTDVESNLPESSAIIEAIAVGRERQTMELASDRGSTRVIHRCGKDCGQSPRSPSCEESLFVGWRATTISPRPQLPRLARIWITGRVVSRLSTTRPGPERAGRAASLNGSIDVCYSGLARRSARRVGSRTPATNGGRASEANVSSQPAPSQQGPRIPRQDAYSRRQKRAAPEAGSRPAASGSVLTA